MIFATDGFYTGYEPSFVRDRFINRSKSRFGTKEAEFEKNGKQRFMPCNHLQKIDDFDQFLSRRWRKLKKVWNILRAYRFYLPLRTMWRSRIREPRKGIS